MRLGYVFSLMLGAFLATGALAAERATTEEAKAMAVKAAAHFHQVGEAAAFTDFMKSPEWRDRDLYVFVNRNDGMTLAHGANPALVGKNTINIKDVEGKAFIAAFVAVKDQGWVDYKWRNPQSNAVEEKSSYVVRLNNDAVLGVGAYKH